MTNLTKIERLIDEGNLLLKIDDLIDSPELLNWRSKVLRYLSKVYGTNSIEYLDFEKIKYKPNIYFSNNDVKDFCIKSLKQAILLLTE